MTVTPLSASGRWIVNADGQRVKLAGVNWPGAHEDDMVPSGLDYRDRNEIARQIAEWGFNSVRLTFAVRTTALDRSHCTPSVKMVFGPCPVFYARDRAHCANSASAPENSRSP